MLVNGKPQCLKSKTQSTQNHRRNRRAKMLNHSRFTIHHFPSAFCLFSRFLPTAYSLLSTSDYLRVSRSPSHPVRLFCLLPSARMWSLLLGTWFFVFGAALCLLPFNVLPPLYTPLPSGAGQAPVRQSPLHHRSSDSNLHTARARAVHRTYARICSICILPCVS